MEMIFLNDNAVKASLIHEISKLDEQRSVATFKSDEATLAQKAKVSKYSNKVAAIAAAAQQAYFGGKCMINLYRYKLKELEKAMIRYISQYRVLLTDHIVTL